MEPRIYHYMTLIFVLWFSFGQAQSEAVIKLENNRYYISYIQDYIRAMQADSESLEMSSLLLQMDSLSVLVSEELEKMAETIKEEPVEMYEDSIGDTQTDIVSPDDSTYSWPDYGYEDQNSSGSSDFGIDKFMPFKNKSNTSLVVQFGLNGLQEFNERMSNVTYPELSNGGSWFWDFGLSRKVRIGGKDSKVALHFGISYLLNKFKFENNVRLFQINEKPAFGLEGNLRGNPRLSIGYLNLPVGIKFNFSKKFRLDFGGYAGYRVRSSQSLHYNGENEEIHQTLRGSWKLNNWIYGLSAGVGIGPFNLIGRYNLSSLFRDNTTYDYNTFMFGTSVSLF
ncbi:MAG: hypothetical protein IPM42_09715 [Saprospiraceae bacterium]|nr:hypothetical protein [Saprospiraceae bacterium]